MCLNENQLFRDVYSSDHAHQILARPLSFPNIQDSIARNGNHHLKKISCLLVVVIEKKQLSFFFKCSLALLGQFGLDLC